MSPLKRKPKDEPVATVAEAELPRVLLVMLIDNSGSMGDKARATIDGYNAYVEALQAVSAGVFISLYRFEYGIERVYEKTPAYQVPAMSYRDLPCRNGTALLNSIGQAIDRTEELIRTETHPHKVVICIMTDGEEGGPTDVWENMRRRIRDKKANGWQFNFLGCGMNGKRAADMLGIGGENAMNYDMRGTSAKAAFGKVAMAALRFLSGQSDGVSLEA